MKEGIEVLSDAAGEEISDDTEQYYLFSRLNCHE